MTHPNQNAETLARWLHGRAQLTQEAYKRDVTLALTFWGNPPLESLTLADLQGWQTYMTEVRRLKPRTVIRKMMSLRSLFSFMVEDELIAVNPAMRLKLPKTTSSLDQKLLTPEQIKLILESASSPKEHLLLKLMYGIGARVSEVCHLVWGDFTSRGDGKVQVKLLGKGGKTRFVLIPPHLWSELSAFKGYAIATDSCFGMNRYQAHEAIKAALRTSGLEAEGVTISCHGLRHNHASHSLKAGAPLALVRDTLGHHNVSVTNIYLWSSPDESSSDYIDM